MMDIKAFGKWSTQGIKVEDPGLIEYINIESRYVPKTGSKNIGVKFHKSRTFIVERLVNKVMNAGHKGKKHYKTSGPLTGKGQTAFDLVEEAFSIIEQKTKKNPVEVFVKAVENAAPREEIVAIEYGGARYPKAVECAPQRRVDLALRLMTQGAFHKSFNSKKRYVDCLVDEIVNAYNMSANSAAVAKKQELERQADSAR